MTNSQQLPRKLSVSGKRSVTNPRANRSPAKISSTRNKKTTSNYNRQNAAKLEVSSANSADLFSDVEDNVTSDCEAPLLKSESHTTEGEEILEDVDLQAAIREGLSNGASTNKHRRQCVPGLEASKACGPQLVQCDGCGPKMGFNPLFYLICFLVFGCAVLVSEYSKETNGM